MEEGRCCAGFFFKGIQRVLNGLPPKTTTTVLLVDREEDTGVEGGQCE